MANIGDGRKPQKPGNLVFAGMHPTASRRMTNHLKNTDLLPGDMVTCDLWSDGVERKIERFVTEFQVKVSGLKQTVSPHMLRKVKKKE